MRTVRKLILVAIPAIVLAVAFSSLSLERKRIEAIICGNYMKAISIGARTWAGDNDDNLSSDLISLSNECQVTKVLICPSDPLRTPPANWELITPENISYEIVNRNLKEGDTNGVFLRCKIHGYVGYADGSLFDGKRQLRKD